ncbi:hypothetical protein [Algoriphagus sp.]|uniref:hypothetical protein n=1 Tax=Algoriphagus sp. TaxID=1872435 RepID=UPI00391BC9BC
MLKKRNIRIISAITLIFYPYVVLVVLNAKGFEITPFSLIISFALTLLTVIILWLIGKSLQGLGRKIWKQEKEEEQPEPRNLKEYGREILVELIGLPVVGDWISLMITLLPLGLILLVNEKYELFAYSIHEEIVLYGMIILIWVETLEKEVQIRMCIPTIPIPIKYVCYIAIAVNSFLIVIQWLGLYNYE